MIASVFCVYWLLWTGTMQELNFDLCSTVGTFELTNDINGIAEVQHAKTDFLPFPRQRNIRHVLNHKH
jgi:hypothetical protein